MTEEDTGVKGIKSVAWANTFRCETHAIKLDGTLLCGTKLKDSSIHAGYATDQVTCKKCIKKLNKIKMKKTANEAGEERMGKIQPQRQGVPLRKVREELPYK